MLLNLTENFYLLNLNTNLTKHHSIYYIVSCLFELKEKRIIEIDNNIILKNSNLTHKKYLDIVLNKIEQEEKIKSFEYWIEFFYLNPFLIEKVQESILQSLIEKNVLEIKKMNFLIIFTKDKIIDTFNTKDKVIKNIETILIKNNIYIQEEILILLLLLQKTNSLENMFTLEVFNKINPKLSLLNLENKYSLINSVKECLYNIDSIKASSLSKKGFY